MLVRSVPLDGGTIIPEQLGGDSATALGTLLDAAPRAGLDLPCRSDDADLWFAEAPKELERAKALCTACPIKAECLAGALQRAEPRPTSPGTARTPRPCPPDQPPHP